MNTNNTEGKPMSRNNPMDPRNFLSNIGTPSFSIAQIPQQILQSLNQNQLKTIQQRHQQILASRIQQQQQQQPQPNNDQFPLQSPQMQAAQLQRTGSVGSNNQSPAAIMQQMNVQQRLAQMSEQTKQATAQALQQRQRQQQPPPPPFDQRTMPQQQQQMPPQQAPPPQQQQQQIPPQQGQPPPQQNSSNRNGNAPPTINLPPQIAQLPLPQQLQVLTSLKEQAISKGNPAIVSAIIMAQQQVQEKLQRQIQQQQQQQQQQQMQRQASQPPINAANPNMAPNMPNNAAGPGGSSQFMNISPSQMPNQMNNVRGPQPLPPPQPMPPQQQGIPPQNIQTQPMQNNIIQDQISAMTASVQQKARAKSKTRKTPTIDQSQLNNLPQTKNSVSKPSRKSSHSLPTGINIPQLPMTAGLQIPTNVAPLSMPKLELPEFRTIKYDMPETKLPYPEYWSESSKPTTDSLLYEQFIQRDKHNTEGKEKEKRGYEPFSIYGFSNREYMAKLFHTLKYYQELKNTRMESITSTAKNVPAASIWGTGYSGYGNGITNTATKIISGHKDDIQLDELAISRQAMNETYEDLVPIRLEFDQERDKFFLRDTFLWNRNDTVVSVDDFVHEMVKDYRFNKSYQSHFAGLITQAMREQLQEFQSNPYNELKRKRLGGDDLRIRIKLDIVVGQNQLIDQFEWDISNSDNCAEEFAESMCQELLLPGEFTTAIAHSIREQVHMYHKSLALLGYRFDGSPVEDDDIRSRLLPVITLDDTFRLPSDSKNFTPNLIQISIAELERLDKDKDRDTRRKRRQGRFNRRGNVSNSIALNTMGANNSNSPLSGSGIMGDNYLPDVADIPRTFRTPIPSTILPGGIDMGPSVNSYTLKTVTEYKARPLKPKAELPPCYIIDHIPGQSLLVSIKTGLPKPNPATNQMPTSEVSHPIIMSNMIKQEMPPMGSQPLQRNNSVKFTGPPTTPMDPTENPQLPHN